MTAYCPILRRLMPPQLPLLFANVVAVAPSLLLLLYKCVLSLACLNSQWSLPAPQKLLSLLYHHCAAMLLPLPLFHLLAIDWYFHFYYNCSRRCHISCAVNNADAGSFAVCCCHYPLLLLYLSEFAWPLLSPLALFPNADATSTAVAACCHRQLIVNFQYCPCCCRLRCCWCLLSVQLACCMTTVVVNVVQATAVSTAANPTISTAISPTFSTAIVPAGWLLPAGWSLLLYKKILLAVVVLSPLAFKILLVVAVIVINDAT